MHPGINSRSLLKQVLRGLLHEATSRLMFQCKEPQPFALNIDSSGFVSVMTSPA